MDSVNRLRCVCWPCVGPLDGNTLCAEALGVRYCRELPRGTLDLNTTLNTDPSFLSTSFVQYRLYIALPKVSFFASRVGKDMAILRAHLNLTDMLVMFVFVVSELCWLLTYSWRGGPGLCKVDFGK